MGSYATTTSISLLIPYALKGNTTTSDTVGTAIFAKQITNAETIVNSYISARYSLPFTTIPPLLTTLTEGLAVCGFIKASYVQDGQIDNKYWEAFCKSAYETLENIKNGETKLTLTDGSLVAPKTSSRFMISSENYAPVFGMDEPTEWGISTNQLDEIESERDGAE